MNTRPMPVDVEYAYQAYLTAVEDLREYGRVLEGDRLLHFWEQIIKFEGTFMNLTTEIATRMRSQGATSLVDDARMARAAAWAVAGAGGGGGGGGGGG